MKYSPHVISLTVNFMREMQHELGEFAEDKLEAMLDAFDPTLRKQILVHVLKGDIKGGFTVRFDKSVQTPQKITFIKELRALTGFGLRESKDIADAAEANGYATVPGQYDYSQRSSFASKIYGSGFEVV